MEIIDQRGVDLSRIHNQILVSKLACHKNTPLLERKPTYRTTPDTFIVLVLLVGCAMMGLLLFGLLVMAFAGAKK